MSLILHYHPLSSYCWKVLIPLYEAGVAFTPHLVDLGNPASRGAFLSLWPIGKFPVIETDGEVVPESTPIIEWLSLRYPSAASLIPVDPEAALQVRRWDRFFDLYVHAPMQQITGDRLRPPDARDPLGVERARAGMAVALDVAEAHMAGRVFVAGESFSLADCAAAPALHYGNRVVPFGPDRPNLSAYLARLEERPSFARVLAEAAPYAHLFPSG